MEWKMENIAEPKLPGRGMADYFCPQRGTIVTMLRSPIAGILNLCQVWF
jgi:hypothetical protein